MSIVQPVASDRLSEKLNSFITRYYHAALIRGLVVSAIGTIAGWFLLFLLEFLLYLPGSTRFILLLFGFLIPVLFLSSLVVPALLSKFRIRKGLSYESAAAIISSHFTEIEDRLINLLQLRQLDPDRVDHALLLAAIEQKTERIDPYDFRQVVSLRPPRWLLRGSLVIVVLVGGSVILKPGIVTQSPERLLNYNTLYEKPAPFAFELLSDSLHVYQGESYKVRVKVSGDFLPAEVRIVTDRGEFLMKKAADPAFFDFLMKEVQNDIAFHFTAVDVHSRAYKLKVDQLPGISSFQVRISYPGYLNRMPETVEGTGDLIVPSGSLLEWAVKLKGNTRISFRHSEGVQVNEKPEGTISVFKTRALSSFRYSLLIRDKESSIIDSLSYTCQVIADQAPEIVVTQVGDTAAPDLFFFSGDLRDDYGIGKLLFSVENAESDQPPVVYPVSVQAGVQTARFYFNLLADTLNLEPGVSYRAWFTVFDNNFTTGPSSARSAIFTLRKYTREEMAEMSRELSESSLSRLKALREQQETQKAKMEDVDYKLQTQGQEEWNDKKKLKDMVQQQLESFQEVQELKKKLQRESDIRSRMSDSYLDKFAQKEQELMELMRQVLDEETLRKLDEMRKLIDSISNQEMKEKMDDLKKSLSEFEENLERNLELYKELALQKEMFETAERLKELSEKQKKLAQETTKPGLEKDASEAQKQINEEFTNIQQVLDSLDRKNEELQRDTLSADFRQKEQKASNDLNKASDNLKKGKSDKARESQESAAEQMESMSNDLNAMLEEEEQESLEESIARMRAILQNVVESSFQQEKLIEQTGLTSVNDPLYLKLGADQRMLKSGLMAMRDSLVVLGKRESSIPPFLFTLFDQIDGSLEAVLKNYSDRRVSGINLNQRNAMTDMNNLALLLGEAMLSMQQQSNMNMMSSGSCKNSKPKKGGKGKPSLKRLRQAQEKLNQQLKEMRQKGKEKGKEGQEGQKQGEQFSRMAMEQSVIRRELESYMKGVQEESGTVGTEMKKIAQEMDQTESDLVYKRMTNATMERQEKILTRLLESERTEQEREKEQRRESKAGNLNQSGNPFQDLQYNDVKRSGEDIYLRESLKFNLFYQSKIIRYQHNTSK